jgi:hypothetical protein
MASDDWRSLATCSNLSFPKIISARSDDAIQTEHSSDTLLAFALRAVEHVVADQSQTDRERTKRLGIPQSSHLMLGPNRKETLTPQTASALFRSTFANTARPIHSVSAGSVCEVLAGLGRGRRFYMVPHGEHRSTPSVIAGLAGLLHDRHCAANYESKHDKCS